MRESADPFRPFPSRSHATRHGVSASTLAVGHAWLELVRVGAGVRVPEHGHDSTHLCYLFRGAMVERERRASRTLEPGGLRLSPGGDRHRIRAEADGFACLVIRIADPAIAAAGLRPPDGRRWLEPGPATRLAAGMLAEVRRGDDASPISVDLLATELLAMLQGPRERAPRAAPAWLDGVRDRLRDDPRRLPTLEELATEAGVSRAHLARAFRRHTGRTIGDFVRRLRVERARGLLARTELPLSRVAFEAGFADQSHMNRLVLELLGVTPGGLRKGARGDATPVQDDADLLPAF